MAVPERVSREEIREMSRGLPPPTPDDVSITSEGVRLDTKEKVIAFFERLDQERLAGDAGASSSR